MKQSFVHALIIEAFYTPVAIGFRKSWSWEYYFVIGKESADMRQQYSGNWIICHLFLEKIQNGHDIPAFLYRLDFSGVQKVM